MSIQTTQWNGALRDDYSYVRFGKIDTYQWLSIKKFQHELKGLNSQLNLSLGNCLTETLMSTTIQKSLPIFFSIYKRMTRKLQYYNNYNLPVNNFEVFYVE